MTGGGPGGDLRGLMKPPPPGPFLELMLGFATNVQHSRTEARLRLKARARDTCPFAWWARSLQIGARSLPPEPLAGNSRPRAGGVLRFQRQDYPRVHHAPARAARAV
jgi:hypothetical protein